MQNLGANRVYYGELENREWLARVHHVVVFKTKVCISRLKIR